MTQDALKKEILDQAGPQVSEAMSSIRDTIKNNLEQGFDHFKDPQKAAGEALTMETQTLDKALPKADIFYLTDVLEADGSITKLEKKEETGMSDTKSVAEDVATEAGVEGTIEETTTSTEELPKTEMPAMSKDFTAEASTPPTTAPELTSKETMVESAAAFSELSDMARHLSSTASQTTQTEPVTPQNAGGYTVEALMREMLRPMLKEWLDANLPSLVKWLVTEQIEKMLKSELGFVPAAQTSADTSAQPSVQTSGKASVDAAEFSGDQTADGALDKPAEAVS